jgi:hypothetical protein
MSDAPSTVEASGRSDPSGWNQLWKFVATGISVVGSLGLGLTAGPFMVIALGGNRRDAITAYFQILLYPAMPIIKVFNSNHGPVTLAGAVVLLLSVILGYGLTGAIVGCLSWCAAQWIKRRSR